jgi:putative flippase GtrA
MNGGPGPASAVKRIPAFVVVGTIGFLVDAAALMLFIDLGGLDPYTARMLSFVFAVTATWQLNRHWTFRSGKVHRLVREYYLYILVQVFGVLINFAIYSLCIFNSEFLEANPVLALAAGSLVAMVFNFLGAHHVVFNGWTEAGDGKRPGSID